MSLLRASGRMVALLTLVVLMTLFVSVNCHAVGTRAAGLHATTSVPLPAAEHADTPCCPIDNHDHSDVDHCASCLHCACNASLLSMAVLPTYAPALSSLVTYEQFHALSDVFLPKFIPPQNLA